MALLLEGNGGAYMHAAQVRAVVTAMALCLASLNRLKDLWWAPSLRRGTKRPWATEWKRGALSILYECPVLLLNFEGPLLLLPKTIQAMPLNNIRGLKTVDHCLFQLERLLFA